jgi:hypothetical protein
MPKLDGRLNIGMLQDNRCFHRLWTRPDTVRLSVTMIGAKMEIDIFEDDHLKISRFHGDESVEGGSEMLTDILKSEQL